MRSGAILVWEVFGNRIISSQPLTDGEIYDVPSLVVHGFAVLEDAEIVEEYWADRGGTVRRDDISRLCHGGRNHSQNDLLGTMQNLPLELLKAPFSPAET